MSRFLVINGPNLDQLGRREPEIYGSKTLAQVDAELKELGRNLSVEVESYQSNRESDLIAAIASAADSFDGIILNPAALTHESRPLGDAIASTPLPVVEVHISNILEREAWRRRSVIDPVHRIYGRGTDGYKWALRHLHHRAAMPFERLAYGPLPDQFGDLRAPSDASVLVVVVHGGLWRHEWTADTTEAIAIDLSRRGYATLNLEYRRMGLGGGWPESFLDVALALEKTPELLGFSAGATVLLGHSAGATMALWAHHPGHTIAMAPFVDLVEARQKYIAGDTFQRLLVDPLPDPSSYSPAHRLPRSGPTLLMASRADRLVPIEAVTRYYEAAQSPGPPVDLLIPEGGHFSFLQPSSATWGLTTGALETRKPPL